MTDLTNPENIIRELFDDDRWIKDEFANCFREELTQLAEALAICFRLIPMLNEAANRTQTIQSALVSAFAFGVLDDLLVSTKLLLSGKLLAAGNVMRQAIEGVAMSVLCSTNELVIMSNKKKQKPPVKECYWKKLVAGDRLTHGRFAVDQLAWNASVLVINAEALKRLQQARTRYNTFSHAGPFAIASRVSLGAVGVAYAGGHYDAAKLEAYRVEVKERIGLCRVLPKLMQRLLGTIATHTNI